MNPILLSLLAILWCLGFLILWRIPVCRPGSGRNSSSSPTLSIIIPARNEEHNLPRLLASIKRQNPQPAEIIVVDDHSTDATPDIARAFGARIVEARPLPPGWVGKAWACAQGADAAGGQLFLFVDADTFFEPDGLRGLLDTFLERGGAVSVGPFHRTERFYEQFSSFFNLILMAGMGAFTILGNKIRPTGLFGPSLLVSKEDYHRVGGHAAVKGKILEDLYLGDEFVKIGVPIHLFSGRGTLSFRMYPNGIKDLVNGWSKAFATGAGKTRPLILTLIILWITGGMLATLQLVSLTITRSPWTILAPAIGLYAGYVIQILRQLREVGTFTWLTALFFPLHLGFFFFVFARSAYLVFFRKAVNWKGRGIDVEKPQ
jgi:4,4'-diaponeurosporenoate glycosyltransferase